MKLPDFQTHEYNITCLRMTAYFKEMINVFLYKIDAEYIKTYFRYTYHKLMLLVLTHLFKHSFGILNQNGIYT